MQVRFGVFGVLVVLGAVLVGVPFVGGVGSAGACVSGDLGCPAEVFDGSSGFEGDPVEYEDLAGKGFERWGPWVDGGSFVSQSGTEAWNRTHENSNDDQRSFKFQALKPAAGSDDYIEPDLHEYVKVSADGSEEVKSSYGTLYTDSWDLSGVSGVDISFKYLLTNPDAADVTGYLQVEYSPDGGDTWWALSRFDPEPIEGVVSAHRDNEVERRCAFGRDAFPWCIGDPNDDIPSRAENNEFWTVGWSSHTLQVVENFPQFAFTETGSYRLKSYYDYETEPGASFYVDDLQIRVTDGDAPVRSDESVVAWSDPLPAGAVLVDEASFNQQVDGSHEWGVWTDGGRNAYLTRFLALGFESEVGEPSGVEWGVGLRSRYEEGVANPPGPNGEDQGDQQPNYSSILTANSDFTEVEDLVVAFELTAYQTSIAEGDRLELSVSTNSGVDFFTVGSWVAGVDFVNLARQSVMAVIPGDLTAAGRLTTTTQVRLQAHTASIRNQLYVDDLKLYSVGTGAGVLSADRLIDWDSHLASTTVLKADSGYVPPDPSIPAAYDLVNQTFMDPAVYLDGAGEFSGSNRNSSTSNVPCLFGAVEHTDDSHSEFGPHITMDADPDLGSDVFTFHIHQDDHTPLTTDDRAYPSPDTDRCRNDAEPGEDSFRTDRQRVEIKGYDDSEPHFLGEDGETHFFSWRMKLPCGFSASDKFTHIHQLKPKGGDNESMPLITLTPVAAKTSIDDPTEVTVPAKVNLRYSPTAVSQVTLASADLDDVACRWVHILEKVSYGGTNEGRYEFLMLPVEDLDGDPLIDFTSDSLPTWKGGDFVRPKWGVYRSIAQGDKVKDEMIKFADFVVAEVDHPLAHLGNLRLFGYHANSLVGSSVGGVLPEAGPALGVSASGVGAVAAGPLPVGGLERRGLGAGVVPVVDPPVVSVGSASLSGSSGALVSVVGVGGTVVGDTSLDVYWDIDAGLVDDVESWVVEVGSQTSAVLTAGDVGEGGDVGLCAEPLSWCVSIAAGGGWDLTAGESYEVEVTAVLADGSQVSGSFDGVTARAVAVPPVVDEVQVQACGCADVAGRVAGAQVVRGFGVNTATGAYGRVETDLSGGNVGIPVRLSRYYSSSDTVGGMFGPGWSSSWDVRVEEDTSGDVVLWTETGTQVAYTADGDGSYTPPPGVRSELADDGDGWLLTTVEGNKFSFTSDGVVSAIVDPRGDGLSFGYDSGGRLVTVTDALGDVWTLSYYGVTANLLDQVETITGPDGSEISYAYWIDSRLATVTLAEGSELDYSYDSDGLLSEVIDPNGDTQLTTTYEAVDVSDTSAGFRVVSQVDAAGAEWAFDWSAMSSPGTGKVAFTDPDGVTVTDEYLNFQVLSSQNANGDAQRMRYDSEGRAVLVLDPNGGQRELGYDNAGNPETVTAPWPFMFTEERVFGLGNQPTSVTDGEGNTWTATYDTDGYGLSTRTDPTGGVWSYTYDSDTGLVATVTDPLGAETAYTYTGEGSLDTVTTPQGRVTSWSYDNAGRVESVAHPGAVGVTGAEVDVYTTNFAYQEPDADSVRAPGGGRGVKGAGKDWPSWTFFDELGRVSATRDENFAFTDYTYDNAGRLESVTDSEGGVVTYSYTPGGRLESVTDPDGGVTAYTYDDRGWLQTVTSPRGGGNTTGNYTVTTTYDMAGNVLRVSRPGVVDSTALVWDYRYDSLFRVTTATDPTGTVTDYEYDNLGNVTEVTVTGADGVTASTSTTYDEMGRPVSVTDPRGETSTVSYDALGQVTTREAPSGASVSFSHDSDGLVESVTDPNGEVTTFDYDLDGNHTSTTDPLGHQAQWEFDAAGRVTAAIDPNGNTTTYTYNNVDQLTSVTRPDAAGSTSYAYDGNGNLTKVTDPAGNATTYSYTARGLLDTVTDPLGRTKSYAYNADGQLSRAYTQGAGTGTPFEIAYTNNALGQVTRVAMNAADTANEPTGTVNGGEILRSYNYGYDPLGRTVQVGSPTGLLTVDRDGFGRITSTDREGRTHTYTYDAAGNTTSRTAPDGTSVSATYTADGYLDKLTQTDTNLTWDYTYDDAGYHTATSVGNLNTTRTLDQAGRLTAQTTTQGGSNLVDYEFSYDNAGLPATITTTRGQGGNSAEETVAYTYDSADRLTKACYGTTDCATNGTHTLGYTYDDLGNRTTQTNTDHTTNGDGTETTTYTYNAGNELTTASVVNTTTGIDNTTAYTYDAYGNQTSRLTTPNTGDTITATNENTFAYHLDGTLAATSQAMTTNTNTPTNAVFNPAQTVYAYDGLGNRVTTATSGSGAADVLAHDWDITSAQPFITTRRYGTTPTGDLTNTTWNDAETYLHGPHGEPLAITTQNTTGNTTTPAVHIHDHQYGVAALTAPNNADVYAVYDYDPFGNPYNSPTQAATYQNSTTTPTNNPSPTTPFTTDTIYNPFHYTGAYTDTTLSSTGDYTLTNRQYDPTTGQFTAPDPLTAPQSGGATSPYTYTNNTPTAYTDPLGLSPTSNGSTSGIRGFWQRATASSPTHLPPGYKNIPTNPIIPLDTASIVSTTTGVAATGICLATTAGQTGATCAAIGGAIGGATTYTYQTKIQHTHTFTWTGLATTATTGAIFGTTTHGIFQTLPTTANLLTQTEQAITNNIGMRMASTSLQELEAELAELEMPTFGPQTLAEHVAGLPRKRIDRNLDRVFMGHGGTVRGPGEGLLRMPEGTRLVFYAQDGEGLEFRSIRPLLHGEGGGLNPVEVIEPGQWMENMTLTRIEDLEAEYLGYRASTTMESLTQLLRPGLGTCHWLSCRGTVEFDRHWRPIPGSPVGSLTSSSSESSLEGLDFVN